MATPRGGAQRVVSLRIGKEVPETLNPVRVQRVHLDGDECRHLLCGQRPGEVRDLTLPSQADWGARSAASALW